MSKILSLFVYILSALIIEHSYAQQPNNEKSTYIGALRESKYVFHGRDILIDEGIYSFETTFQQSDISLSFWYAIGDASNYQELDTTLSYAFEVSGFESYVGYSRYEYISDNENDDEVSAGISYTISSLLTPAVDYAYSFDANGSFIEVSLQSDMKLFTDRLTLSLYAIQAFDFGYETKEYDGFNNFLIGAKVGMTLAKSIEINGFIAHSIAQEDIKLEGLGNLTWGGIGLYMAF